MTRLFVRSAAFALVGLTAACASTVPRSTEVTRFHIEEPIPTQAVTVAPADEADTDSLEFRTYADIVAAELARLGFDASPEREAGLIALVDIARDTRFEAARRSPLSIGIGGGSYGRRGGVGVGVSTDVGGSRGGEVMMTKLEVALQRRTDGETVWEGRAVRADRPEDANRAAVVARLASALFQDFPGESGRTITVE